MALAITAAVGELGTFAVQVPLPGNAPRLVLAELRLATDHDLLSEALPDEWIARAAATFRDGGDDRVLGGTGGPPRVDGRPLDWRDDRFLYQTSDQAWRPGDVHAFTVPGGDEVPPLAVDVLVPAGPPVLTAPVWCGSPCSAPAWTTSCSTAG